MKRVISARVCAARLGLRHIRVKSDDLRLAGVARNDRARCYHCKKAIRRHARKMGLPNAWKLPEACLATRIPCGKRLTKRNLSAVENMESGLSKLGFTRVRARYHGAMVCIEVGAAELNLLLRPATRRRVIALGRRNGFKIVSADLEGYRMGNMNAFI